jgi:hypothetical protein
MRTVQNSIFLGYNGAMVDIYSRIFTSRLSRARKYLVGATFGG